MLLRKDAKSTGYRLRSLIAPRSAQGALPHQVYVRRRPRNGGVLEQQQGALDADAEAAARRGLPAKLPGEPMVEDVSLVEVQHPRGEKAPYERLLGDAATPALTDEQRVALHDEQRVALRVDLRYRQGRALVSAKRHEAAIAPLQSALTLQRPLGDPLRLGQILHVLAEAVGAGDAPLPARALFEEALVQRRAAADVAGEVRTLVNYAQWHVRLGEWDVHGQIGTLGARNLSAGFNHGKRLARRPSSSARLDLDREFGAWGFGISGIAEAARWDDVGNSLRVGGYGTLDARVSWRFTNDWTLQASLVNALGRNYETSAYYLQPGREVSLSLRWQPK